MISLEDLVYKFDETHLKIQGHIGVNNSDWVHRGKFFKVNETMKNTKLWEKHPEYQVDCDRILCYLTNYCYRY